MDAKAIGERVRELRKSLPGNWSQRKLDMVAGVGHGYISKLEMGQVNPTVAMLQRVAAALSTSGRVVTVEDLLVGAGGAPLPADPGAGADGKDEVPPEIAQAQVNLYSVYKLNPEAAAYLADTVRAIMEREERRYLEAQRAKRRARKVSGRGRQTDSQTQAASEGGGA